MPVVRGWGRVCVRMHVCVHLCVCTCVCVHGERLPAVRGQVRVCVCGERLPVVSGRDVCLCVHTCMYTRVHTHGCTAFWGQGLCTRPWGVWLFE